MRPPWRRPARPTPQPGPDRELPVPGWDAIHATVTGPYVPGRRQVGYPPQPRCPPTVKAAPPTPAPPLGSTSLTASASSYLPRPDDDPAWSGWDSELTMRLRSTGVALLTSGEKDDLLATSTADVLQRLAVDNPHLFTDPNRVSVDTCRGGAWGSAPLRP